MLGFPPSALFDCIFFFNCNLWNIVSLTELVQVFLNSASSLQVHWPAFNCLWCLSPFLLGWLASSTSIPNTRKNQQILQVLSSFPSAELLKGWGTPAFILAAYHCSSTLCRYFNCGDIWCKMWASKSFPTLMVFKALRYLVQQPGLQQAHHHILWHLPFPWLISTSTEGKQ